MEKTMTDVTDRLDAIQATVNNHKKAPGGVYGPGSDVAFLLGLARKQQAALEAVRKLHPRTCEINGDSTDCNESKCPMLVCGPCGEGWPCPTIRALDGDDA
jgi:hypothetical protein